MMSFLEIIAIYFLSIILLVVVFKVLCFLWTCCVANLLGFGVKWRSGENVWAVITGATDGIGLQYAKQLAAKGYSLLLISRNEDKLNSVASQIKAEFQACKQIKVIAADFSKRDIYGAIGDALNSLEEIDVLVNNVGTVYHRIEYFTKIPLTFNEEYYNVNMVSFTEMTALVMPRMEIQKRGVIINVSSQAGTHPIPLMAAYSATKAYMSFLSEALSVEYASKGIIIQTVKPNQVRTKLVKGMQTIPFFSVTPEEYVSAAIKTVGIESSTYGHWKHKIFCSLQDVLPLMIGERLSMTFTYFILNMVRQKRSKAGGDTC